METTMNNGKSHGVLAAPERNHYFYGKLLDVQQLQKEQHYGMIGRRRINGLVLGNGVVCGLNVVADTEAMVRIQPGVALDALGREIIVPEAFRINPHQLTDDQGRATGEPIATGTTGTVELCLAYAEKKTDLVPVLVPDCDTPGNCAPSTIREGFYVIVRLAEGNAPAPPSCQLGDFPIPAAVPLHDLLCERLSAPCPEPPADPCVPLARVTLPLQEESINTHAGRRLIYSNTLLYELIVCLAERVGQIAGGRFLRHVSGDGQSGSPGQQLNAPLELEVVDGEGNPMDGVRVEFETTAGGSVDPVAEPTNQEGRAQTLWTLGPEPGEQQVIARAVGTAFTVTFRAIAGDA
jgi:hypothetical protein